MKNPQISIQKQCELLSIPKSTYYHMPIDREDHKAVAKIIDIYRKFPVYGYRRITAEMMQQGFWINRKKGQRQVNFRF